MESRVTFRKNKNKNSFSRKQKTGANKTVEIVPTNSKEFPRPFPNLKTISLNSVSAPYRRSIVNFASILQFSKNNIRLNYSRESEKAGLRLRFSTPPRIEIKSSFTDVVHRGRGGESADGWPRPDIKCETNCPTFPPSLHRRTFCPCHLPAPLRFALATPRRRGWFAPPYK